MTLSEALVAIFIILIISSLVIGIFFTFYNIYKSQLVQKELTNDNTITLNTMSGAIKNASKIIQNATINGHEYTTGSNTLVMELPSIDNNSNVIEGKFDFQVFYQDGSNNKLLKSELMPDAASTRNKEDQIIAFNTSNILFHFNNISYSDASQIQIVFVSTKTANNVQYEAVSQVTANLRNF